MDLLRLSLPIESCYLKLIQEAKAVILFQGPIWERALALHPPLLDWQPKGTVVVLAEV